MCLYYFECKFEIFVVVVIIGVEVGFSSWGFGVWEGGVRLKVWMFLLLFWKLVFIV